jgi:hypothetical protein
MGAVRQKAKQHLALRKWNRSKLGRKHSEHGAQPLKSFSLFSVVGLLPCSPALKKKYCFSNQYDPLYRLAGPADLENDRGSRKSPLSFSIGHLHGPTRHVIMTKRSCANQTTSRRTVATASARGRHPEETDTIAQNAAQNVDVNQKDFFFNVGLHGSSPTKGEKTFGSRN